MNPYEKEALGITPNIERFARDGVQFQNHFIDSASCMPARRDIFTGRMQFSGKRMGGIEPFDPHETFDALQGYHDYSPDRSWTYVGGTWLYRKKFYACL